MATLTDRTSRTIITPQGYHTGKCGYCHGNYLKTNTDEGPKKAEQPNEYTAINNEDEAVVQDVHSSLKSSSNQSYYVSASTLSVEDYQRLVDRGWRRSGKLLYKQNRRVSCCPHYTIRLEASKYKSKKEQRQVISKWNKYVLGKDLQKKLSEEAARAAAKNPELMKARQRAKKGEKDEKDLENSIHASEYDTVKHLSVQPDHQFQITLEPSDFTKEKFDLFKSYQINIHHEKEKKQTPESFTRFLCETPLTPRIGTTEEDRGRKYGSYHQLYRLDGKLIAMAVLDLLPNCVSSVYFMYDTAYSAYSMGKLSACREIVLAREGGYKYYYLGFYIHRNKKMEYKALFSPSELLDPESNVFHPMEQFVPPNGEYKALNAFRYVSVDDPDKNCRPCKESSPGEEKSYYVRDIGKYQTLWERGMPGINSVEDMKSRDLGSIDIRVGGVSAQAWQLRGFTMDEIEQEDSIARHIAEMAAVMGPDVVMDAVVAF